MTQAAYGQASPRVRDLLLLDALARRYGKLPSEIRALATWVDEAAWSATLEVERFKRGG